MKKLLRLLVFSLIIVLVIASASFAAIGVKPKFVLDRFKIKLGETQSIKGILSADEIDYYMLDSSNDSVIRIEGANIKAVSTGISELSYTYYNSKDEPVRITCDVEVTTNYSTFAPVGSSSTEKIILTLVLDDYTVDIEGKSGAIPTLPEVTKKDYILEGWYKDYELAQKLGEKERLSQNISLYPKWITEEEKNYKEITPSSLYDDITYHWARTAIESVSYMNLFKGKSEREFDPDSAMTRAMAITVLGRLENADVSGLKSDAKDATSGSYYDGYLAWAISNKILELEDGNFRPQDAITREEMASILANYIKLKGFEYEIKDISFSDMNEIAEDKLEAVKILNSLEIMQGNSDGTYNPKGSTTRAQIAQIFYNYNNFVNKEK